MHLIEREQFFPQPPVRVFEFFSDAGNLAAITPGFLRFKVLTPLPLDLREGALLDYRLRLYGVPVKWRTRIEEVVRNERFVDMAIRSPFKRWHHTHTFEDKDGGTLMRDRVEYLMPFGPLGALTRAVMIRRLLERIFDYRYEIMAARFG